LRVSKLFHEDLASVEHTVIRYSCLITEEKLC